MGTRSPLADIFTLVATLLGIYGHWQRGYVDHAKGTESRKVDGGEEKE